MIRRVERFLLVKADPLIASGGGWLPLSSIFAPWLPRWLVSSATTWSFNWWPIGWASPTPPDTLLPPLPLANYLPNAQTSASKGVFLTGVPSSYILPRG